MKFLKMLLLSGLMLTVFSGCLLSSEGAMPLESVLDPNSDVVFVVDYSDEAVVENLERIAAKLSFLNLSDAFARGWNDEADDGYKFEDISPMLEGKWKLAIGATMLDDYSDLENMNVSIWFDDEKLFRDFLDKVILEEGGKYEEVDGVEYWDLDIGSYMFYDKGLFVISVTEELRDDSLERLNEGTGYVKPGVVTVLADDYVAYAYVNSSIMSEAAAVMNSPILEGAFYFVFSAEKDGLKLSFKSYFPDMMNVEEVAPDYTVHLADKVPGKGVFMFGEQHLNLAYALKIIEEMGNENAFVDSGLIARGAKDVLAEENPFNLIDEGLRQVSEIAGISKEDLVGIFDGGFAFSMSDNGSYLPGIAFYIDVDEEYEESAKKLMSSLGTFVDEMLAELDVLMAESGVSGIVKKEVVLYEGAGIQKLSLDWDSVPSEMVDEPLKSVGLSKEDLVVEFYYGLMSDGVMVFSLYPNFLEEYGNNPVSESGYYAESLVSLGGVSDYTYSIYRIEPIFDLVERYFELAENIEPGISSQTKADFITETGISFNMVDLLKFRYFVMGAEKLEDGMKGVLFVRVDE